MNMEPNLFDRHFDSLEAIADTVSELLQCPVTIEDASHNLVAYSSHHAETDSARIATIIGRRVPEQVISTLWREGIMQQLMTSSEPVRIEEIREVGLGNRIAIAIRHHGEVLGYIWVLEYHEPLGDTALLQLKQAAGAAKMKLMQLQTQRRRQEQHSHDFFWQLLTGHHVSETVIREKAAQIGIMLPPSYQILLLQFETAIDDRLYRQIHYMVKTAQRMRIVLHVAHNDRLIILSSPLQGGNGGIRQYREECGKLARLLKQRFDAEPVLSGASAFREPYAAVEDAYREALAVLHLKRRFPAELQDAGEYGELGYYRYLPLLADERRRHPVAHPGLSKLRQYDLEHQSGLLHTLEMMLKHDGNVKKAAEALHIHGNTLMYRMKRIADISDIDLASMDEKVTLYLEYKLNQLEA